MTRKFFIKSIFRGISRVLRFEFFLGGGEVESEEREADCILAFQTFRLIPLTAPMAFPGLWRSGGIPGSAGW